MKSVPHSDRTLELKDDKKQQLHANTKSVLKGLLPEWEGIQDSDIQVCPNVDRVVTMLGFGDQQGATLHSSDVLPPLLDILCRDDRPSTQVPDVCRPLVSVLP